MVLVSSFSPSTLPMVRPVAAHEYWLDKGEFRAWFARHIIRIIPVKRERSEQEKKEHVNPLQNVDDALRNEDAIVIFFPEGTRGSTPENLKPFKKGIAYLAKSHPNVPIIPIFLAGLGKILPRGAFVPVPFFIDGFVGEPIEECERDNIDCWMETLTEKMKDLKQEASFLGAWEDSPLDSPSSMTLRHKEN
eukprot:CAMPEP_0174271920 /NCGR_PEP_ID=MMETSP0439-20130205/49469_1 /TAXON_ID=0 /ORGANISM="Stereomyxa ramosa, Strain Chinc5" /LENGTH=190 /DNA_ID=CAMNT_0015362199 /DNA_START=176 /DNA_END=748 /DNA_ORIENTATION=+